MKKVLCSSPGELSLVDAPVPVFLDDEVLIKIKYCGLCSHDLKRYLGRKKIRYPVVLGHEPSGRIEGLGNNVRGLREGDPVLIDVKVACGTCPSCFRGRPHQCENTEASNGFSQYISLPVGNVHRVSSDLDLRTGVLAEPLACILHGAAKIETGKEGSLLVVGDGIMGILAAFAGHVLGGASVTLLGHHALRLEEARKIGVAEICDNTDALKRSALYDSVVLTVFDPRLIDRLTSYLSPGGNLVIIGEMSNGTCVLPLNTIYRNEFVVLGSQGYDRNDFRSSVRILERHAGRLASLISRTYPLGELARGFHDLQHRRILKGVLDLETES